MEDRHQTLTLREAADELGVHYMTAYRYVRLGALRAEKSGAVWQVERADLDRFRNGHTEPPARGDAPWSDRLEARMLAADQAGAWQVVEAALASGMHPSRVYTEMIGPALNRIGARWEAASITIGQEHMATVVANRLIGRLGPRFARRGRAKGTVLATTPPGERHGLGLEMLADILRGAGFDVVTLGSDVPLESLQHALGEVDRLIAVCVSVMVMDDEREVRRTIEAIRVQADRVPILMGGAAITSAQVARSLGADAWAEDGLGAIEELERLTAR